MTESAS